MARQKITTSLWFDSQAEEAAQFYVSIFPQSRITRVVPGPGGIAMLVEFQLVGMEFIAFNGGPMFKFNEAISLSVDCEDQAEVDSLWEQLSRGGETSQCGWLKDKYGLSWQIVPACLGELMSSSDINKKQQVMEALMGMTKLDIALLQQAFSH